MKSTLVPKITSETDSLWNGGAVKTQSQFLCYEKLFWHSKPSYWELALAEWLSVESSDLSPLNKGSNPSSKGKENLA